MSDGTPLSGSGDGIKISTTYLAAGRRVVRSTPYRTTGDLTLEWTCTQLDQLGRATATAIFKGNAEPTDCESSSYRTGISRTEYDADRTRDTDPAGKIRDAYQDGLGRLIKVIEAPTIPALSYLTRYWYDPLDNLCRVSQYDAGMQDPMDVSCQSAPASGVQHRTFTYSSLSRWVQAVNPESGSTGSTIYTYKPSGDLLTRKDARNVTTTHGCDELHHVKNL